MSDVRNSDTHFTLDRRVPLAVIITFALQTATVVWWAAGLAAKTTQLERQISVLESLIQNNTTRDVEYSIRIARLEERIIGMTSELGRVLVRLERYDVVPRQ